MDERAKRCWSGFAQLVAVNPEDVREDQAHDLTASQPMELGPPLRKEPHGLDLTDLAEYEQRWV
eukprot:5218123-Alexandrium_andersonii.AAC.1